MVTLDTSALLTLFDRKSPQHEELTSFLREEHGPLVIPVGILSEVNYFIENWITPKLVPVFLADIEDGAFTLDCGKDDLPRIGKLVIRYRDFPLGYADAAVIACAERHGGRVATLDYRHFGAVAREGTIQIVP